MPGVFICYSYLAAIHINCSLLVFFETYEEAAFIHL